MQKQQVIRNLQKSRKIRINSLQIAKMPNLQYNRSASFRKVSRINTQICPSLNKLTDTQNLSKSKKRLPSLQPQKQYQTKLRISSESWTIFQYKTMAYKRGWKPQQIHDFSGMRRFFILLAWLYLVDNNPSWEDLKFEVQTKYLSEQIQIQRQNRLPPNKRKPLIIRQSMKKNLSNNTAIRIIDMIYGLFMQQSQDMLQYSVLALGYLFSCYQQQVDPSEDKDYFSLQSIADVAQYKRQFYTNINQYIIGPLKLKYTCLESAQILYSTVQQICQIFLQIEKHRIFHEIAECQQKVCDVKVRVGYKYWQNRKIKLTRQNKKTGQQHYCMYSWRGKKYFSVLVKNMELQCMIVLADCKFGMTTSDIKIVQNWLIGIRKPICSPMKSSIKKLNPIMKIADQEYKLVMPKIKRNKTEISQK